MDVLVFETFYTLTCFFTDELFIILLWCQIYLFTMIVAFWSVLFDVIVAPLGEESTNYSTFLYNLFMKPHQSRSRSSDFNLSGKSRFDDTKITKFDNVLVTTWWWK
jgi:hypothetical protein